MAFLSWMFNPWDYGDAALLYGAVTVGISVLCWRLRRSLGAEAASLCVAISLTVFYFAGAVLTAGLGPLFVIGLALLFVPALFIAYAVMFLMDRFNTTIAKGPGDDDP